MALVSCPTCHAAVEPTVPTCPLCGTAITSPGLPSFGQAWSAPTSPGPPTMPTAPPPLAPPPTVPPTPAPWVTGSAGSPPPVPPPAGLHTAPSRERRSRTRILVSLLVVVALGAAAFTWWTTRSDGNDAWVSTTTASGRFRVQLPDAPIRTTESVDVTGQPLVVDLLRVGDLSLEKVATGAMFLEVDISADPAIMQFAADPAVAPTLLYAQAGAVFSTAEIELGPMEPATSQLGPAIEVSGTVTSKGLVARGWMVSAGGSVLAVLVIDSADAVGRAELTRDRIVSSVTA